MVIPTFDVSEGIQLEIYTSFISPILIANYLDEIGSYSHTISADGGFDTLNADLLLAEKHIDDWVENGLGRKVVAKAAGVIVWEGMVNAVTAQRGGITITRGPLVNIANRVSVSYVPIYGYDPVQNEPITGERTETLIADDAESQAKYGIFEVVVDGGNLLDDGTTDDAEQLRDTYLAQSKWPETSTSISTGGNANELSLSIECVGLGEYLKHYIYNDDTDNSAWVITKLTAVLDADPSGFFSTNRTRLEDNLMLVNAFENENRSAGDIIKELLDIGDINDNRYIFGFYEDGIPEYRLIPTTIDYQYSVYNDKLVIARMNGSPIKPWLVRPGYWLLLPDVLIGRTLPVNDFRVDPRAQFIEKVNFTAPNSVTVETARLRTITQLMNRISSGALV